ncbi:phosphatase PAP2 family protein [Hyphococcus sp.]|uniref:phosphatase PAP2 family protein n=1 Tax=Hyphococcus sp. TaxID=2038636 RepID=UPI0035C77893
MMRRARGEIAALAALAVAALGLLTFAEVADEMAEGDSHVIDEQILLALRSPTNPSDPIGPGWVELGVSDVTALGGYIVLTFLVVSVVVYLLVIGKWRNAVMVSGASVSGVFLSELLKVQFGRPRPELVPQLAEVHSLSFPSGHAMLSAVIYLTLGALLARFHKRKRERALIMVYAVLVTMMVGASRVYLGVHWPTDVLAGWALGAAWAAVWWLVAWRFLRDRQETEDDIRETDANIMH